MDHRAEEEGEEEVEARGEEVQGTVEGLEGEVEEEEDRGAEGAVSHHSDHQQHPWTPPRPRPRSVRLTRGIFRRPRSLSAPVDPPWSPAVNPRAVG